MTGRAMNDIEPKLPAAFERAMQALDAQPVDGTCKGLPPTLAPIAFREIGQQGWNLLNQDLAFPVAVLKRSVALAPLLAVSLGVAPPASAAAGTWTPTGSMTTPRAFHTATLLNSSQVLVAGGNNPHPFGGAYASAERYDPGSGTWSPTQSMATGRTRHTATLLDDGRVLVAGGGTGRQHPTSGGPL